MKRAELISANELIDIDFSKEKNEKGKEYKMSMETKKREKKLKEKKSGKRSFHKRVPWAGKRTLMMCLTMALLVGMMTVPAFATGESVAAGGDPIAVVNNLSNFVFGLIRAVGIILLGWGIVQVGMSFQSHDPSQRSNGFLTLAGGLVITFAKEILNLIMGA